MASAVEANLASHMLDSFFAHAIGRRVTPS
jgi:hypothetical protein